MKLTYDDYATLDTIARRQNPQHSATVGYLLSLGLVEPHGDRFIITRLGREVLEVWIRATR